MLASCGNSNSSSAPAGSGGNTTPPPPSELSGYFIDGPIGGAHYSIQGKSSILLTSGNGEFKYFSGDIVKFAIGGINLGQACLLYTSDAADE